MPFRPLTKLFIPCYLCDAAAPHKCRNCGVFLCNEHVHEGRCRSCEKRLLALALDQEDSAWVTAERVASAMGAIGFLFLPLILTAPLWFLYGLGCLAGMYAVPMRVVRGSSAREKFRAMAERQLPPTPRLKAPAYKST